MTPDQFDKFIAAIRTLSERQFTLTEASDWSILVSGLTIIFILVGVMWKDLRTTVTSNTRTLSQNVFNLRKEMNEKFESFTKDNDKDHDTLRGEIKELRKELIALIFKNKTFSCKDCDSCDDS